MLSRELSLYLEHQVRVGFFGSGVGLSLILGFSVAYACYYLSSIAKVSRGAARAPRHRAWRMGGGPRGQPAFAPESAGALWARAGKPAGGPLANCLGMRGGGEKEGRRGGRVPRPGPRTAARTLLTSTAGTVGAGSAAEPLAHCSTLENDTLISTLSFPPRDLTNHCLRLL